jgi:Flp pilus assembly protein TadG
MGVGEHMRAKRSTSGQARKKISAQRKRNISGQASIEMAFLLPLALVVALIAVNALVFFEECARFDRTVRQTVVALGSTPSAGQTTEALTQQVSAVLNAQYEESPIEIEIAAQKRSDGLISYTAEMAYQPTLFGLPFRTSVFGVMFPTLRHSTNMVVDVYRPGVLW